MIAAALPVVFLLLAWAGLRALDGWREAFVKASIVWGLVVAGNTEVLSVAHILSRPALTAAWILECGVAVAALWSFRAEVSKGVHLTLLRPRVATVVVLLPVGLIIVATGVTALVAPPNTYDSMAYHMARVAHWVTDQTIAFYPTNIVRQLYESPWAEYVVLQLQLLSGGDQLANLAQWFSMVGSVITASLVAEQVGAPRRGQVLAAVVVATLPMGILQASSTQTDYTLSFWILCTVSTLLTFTITRSTPAAGWLAAALGLAMLTKATAYIFAAPMLAVFGAWMLWRLRRRVVVPALVMIAIPLVINSGYYIRNESTFGNPLSASSDVALVANDSITPRGITSNTLRDAVLQFGTPSPLVNAWLGRAVAKVHSQILHIGVNDPRTTWLDTSFAINATSLDEDYAGDPLQALAALVAMIAAFAYLFRRGPPLPAVYSGCIIVAFLLFAAYLKWQPWHSRLELPLLVVAGPLIGAVAARHLGEVGIGLVAAVMLVAAVPWVIDNQTRPIVGFALPGAVTPVPRLLPDGATIFNTSRTGLYFVKDPQARDPFTRAAADTKQLGCRDIGLWSGPADWEYPLWVLAQQSFAGDRVDQVFVTNSSAQAPSFGAHPCYLVVAVPLANPPVEVDLDGRVFKVVWAENGLTAYAPAPS